VSPPSLPAITVAATPSSGVALPAPPPRVRLVVALTAVYVIWGSTYLAMRWAVAGLPPLLMAGVRFLIAGGVLAGIARARGLAAPTWRQWRGAATCGVLFFLGGNGMVALAERDLGSGVAAVVCATMPLWLALMSAATGERPRAREWLGLVLGFAGVAVLAGGADLRAAPLATALLALAPLSWALGSFLARRVALPRGMMGTAAEMLAGGAALLVVGLVHGERVTGVPPASAVLAMAYLIVFGSLLGFSAYAWLLHNARPAVATSYAFVNPALAVVLGVVLGAERLGPTVLIGTPLIILSVALIVIRGRR